MKYSNCKISDSHGNTQPLSVCDLNHNNLNFITLNLMTLRNFGNYLDNFGSYTSFFFFLHFSSKALNATSEGDATAV